MVSSSVVMPCCVRADTGMASISPPYSVTTTPRSASSCLTRSGFAEARSILLMATMIGTCAARAWSIASRVCRGPTALLAHLEAKIRSDNGGGVIVERLVDRRDGAVGEERLNDVGHRH